MHKYFHIVGSVSAGWLPRMRSLDHKGSVSVASLDTNMIFKPVMVQKRGRATRQEWEGAKASSRRGDKKVHTNHCHWAIAVPTASAQGASLVPSLPGIPGGPSHPVPEPHNSAVYHVFSKYCARCLVPGDGLSGGFLC